MKWQSLGIPSEGKFHSAAAKMEVRWANMENLDLICFRLYCWSDHGCKSKCTKQFIKQMAIHSSAKTSDKKKLVQIVRKVFQCYIVEDFFLIVKVGKCQSKELWRHPGSGGVYKLPKCSLLHILTAFLQKCFCLGSSSSVVLGFF